MSNYSSRSSPERAFPTPPSPLKAGPLNPEAKALKLKMQEEKEESREKRQKSKSQHKTLLFFPEVQLLVTMDDNTASIAHVLIEWVGSGRNYFQLEILTGVLFHVCRGVIFWKRGWSGRWRILERTIHRFLVLVVLCCCCRYLCL